MYNVESFQNGTWVVILAGADFFHAMRVANGKPEAFDVDGRSTGFVRVVRAG